MSRALWLDRGPVRRWLSDARTRLGLRRSTRAGWRRRWEDCAYSPAWSQCVPPAVREAVASGWLPRGAAALDVGCGAGVLAEWLGSAGYDVMAVDFAEGAVALARQRVAHLGGRIRAELVDITAGPPPGGPFGVVVDKGCFHALLPRDAVRYGQHVAAACARGARGVILMPIPASLCGASGNQFRRERFARTLERALGPYFAVVELRAARMGDDPADAGMVEEPGLCAYLERR